uniref:ABC transporter n=1 Tax=Cyberlindnera americana TaxID=36016 RepID=A0A5P8N976_9ASCO|nr:ABC transporter [Cyberlindnera americana]
MSLFVPEDQRVSLAVRDLKVVLSTNKLENESTKRWWKGKKSMDLEKEPSQEAKVILNGLNLDLEAGKVLAILGSSGSGKTTFLNTLSARMSLTPSNDNPFQFSGMVQYSQEKPNISYLLQEDVFLPGLTVRETLNFTAQLRLPQSTAVERKELIDYILQSLGLEKVQNTIICDFLFRTTLSGGERRRVSLSIQLLTKPSVLFLDEPTTGLDAHTSIELVSTVKKLASDFGITVILTIHQPRFEILEIVDKLYLLAKGGRLMISGSLQESMDYLDTVGLEGEDSNFADFLLSISSVEKTMSKEVELQTEQRVHMLVEQWKRHEVLKEVDIHDTFMSGSRMFNKEHITVPLHKEIAVLAHRCTLMTLRDYQSLIMMMGILTTLSIICGWVFYKPGGSLAGIRSVTSAMYVCCEVIGFTPMMYEIERLCSVDGKFLIREKKEGMYSITGWFIGRRLAKMILEDIPSTLIWSVITFYMWGLQGNSNFGIYFINNLFLYMIGIAQGHVCFVLGNYHFSTSSLISGIFYQIQNSACGYFISAKTMPVYVRWTKYIASFWYNFGSLVSNQFTDYMGDCVGTADECYEYSGDAVFDNLGYSRNWFTVPLCVSICWFIGFYTASALLFWWKERSGSVKIVKERRSKVYIQQMEHEKPIVDDTQDCDTTVRLSLKNISLNLKPKLLNKLLHKKFNDKAILNKVSASFSPGVNAIMGPSGSGKTTLLNFLTGRTRTSLMSISGGLYLNDERVPLTCLSKITSYVVQDDNVLIPTLTVLETLQFQARLRLPIEKHSEIPRIIHELMRKMGLLDVANVPIGDAITKGISGGEKRRVSIAVQLLNNSKVLLLDEPTSGLDSFTSNQIISLLDDLAKQENKTIILTIHQPKVELFNKFDNVLLLGDGNVIYDGKPLDLIEYFKKLGFQAGNNVNFADFVLDTIAETTDDTMEKLIGNWIKKGPSESDVDSDYTTVDFSFLYKKEQSFSVVFRPVLERQIQVLMRNPDVIYSRVVQLLVLGVVHSLYFAPLKNGSDSILNRLGLIQEVLNVYFAGLFNNMSFYPGEKDTFYQEYEDRIYSPGVFMGVYLLTEVPFEIIPTFIFSIFIVLVIGLPRTARMFFTMFYMSLLSLNCGESVGIIFNSIFDHIGIAMNFLSNVIVVAIFMGGTMSLHMPILFRAFNYISPLKWAVLALAKLGFEGQVFQCVNGSTTCELSTGEQVLSQYGLKSNYSTDMGAIAAITIVYRLIAWLVLELKVRYFRR